MSPVRRPLAGEALFVDLARERETVQRELASASGRIARTLVKQGALRATLVALKPGGELQEHTASGPITIHVLEGDMDVAAQGANHALSEGHLLSLDGGVPHSVSSSEGAMFLLTLVSRTD